MLLLWKCLIVAHLISIVMSVPLEPGQPGGPWTKDEIDIVRDKVICLIQYIMLGSLKWFFKHRLYV